MCDKMAISAENSREGYDGFKRPSLRLTRRSRMVHNGSLQFKH